MSTSRSRAGAGAAALLIELESFLLGREERWAAERAGEPYDLAEDLEMLARFAHELVDGGRLAVRRAYADFNAARRREADGGWDFYLRHAPRQLMEQGVEPVQLFRFPGGTRKSAVDVRLALDASALVAGRAGIERVVLVTGDSDLVPLVLELRAQGVHVAVIGVAGRTKPVLQRYCDQYDDFEELLAASDADGEEGELAPVRAALRTLLERRGPLCFAAVKPLLSRELGRAFDPGAFECDTAGEFLERYRSELGVRVRDGEHDRVVELGADAPPAAAARGDRGPRHTPYEYRWLLRVRNPRVHLVPHDDWDRITELIFERAGGDADERPAVLHGTLSEEVAERAARAGIDAADKKVQAAMFQVFKSGAFVCAEGDPTADFHWSRPARLAPDVESVGDLRARALRYLAVLLLQRMRAEFGTLDVDSEVLTELIEGPDPDEERIQAVESILDEALAIVQGGARPAG